MWSANWSITCTTPLLNHKPALFCAACLPRRRPAWCNSFMSLPSISISPVKCDSSTMTSPTFTSSLQVLAKTQPVAVAVVHLEVATAVGLIADSARDVDALGLELRMERIRVIDPNIGIPGASLRVCSVIGAHKAGLFELRQHD